jgi:hypothetical protein
LGPMALMTFWVKLGSKREAPVFVLPFVAILYERRQE